MSSTERRYYDFRVETRADDESGKLIGYAAVFDTETELRDGLFEVVRQGAFKKTIQEADIFALWNHDDGRVPLGRTGAGTLRLKEDDYGLRVEIDPPESAKDVVEAIQRKDVTKMSFGFRAIRDTVSNRGDAETLRELLEVRLFDVSPVVFPAYQTTDIQARNLITDEHAVELRKRAMPEEKEDPEPVPAGHSIDRFKRRFAALSLAA